jgi:hypothetical protein
LGGSAEHGGLARARRADHHDQWLGAGHGPSGSDLGAIHSGGEHPSRRPADGEPSLRPIVDSGFLPPHGVGGEAVVEGRFGDWPPIRASWREHWDDGRELQVAAKFSAGGAFEPRHEVVGVDACGGRDVAGEFAQQIVRSPCRRRRVEFVDGGAEHARGLVNADPGGLQVATDGVVHELVGGEAVLGEFAFPAPDQLAKGAGVVLGRSGIGRRFAGEPPLFTEVRFATHGVTEPVELHLEPLGCLTGAFGEACEDGLVDAVEFADAVDGCVPGDTEPPSQLGPQAGVVESGQGALVVFDHPRIQGPPSTTRITDLGDHNGMGMQVRILGPAGVLTKDGGGDALRVDHAHQPHPRSPACARAVPRTARRVQRLRHGRRAPAGAPRRHRRRTATKRSWAH